jgi:hypothetical protein
MFLLNWLNRSENFEMVRALDCWFSFWPSFKFIKALGNQPAWPFGRGHHAPARRCRALGGRGCLFACWLAGLLRWPAAAARAEALASPGPADRRRCATLQCPMPLPLAVPLRAMDGRLAAPLIDAVCEPRAPGG